MAPNSSRTLGRRQGGPFRPVLPEAIAEGLIRPGDTVKVVFGGAEGDWREGGASPVYDCNLESIDQEGNTLRLACPGVPGRVPHRRLRLVFAVPKGMIVGNGAVLHDDRTEDRTGRAITVRVQTFRLMEERRSLRVAIPGLRAICRTPFRIVDCPVVNLGAGGILITWPGEDPPAEAMRIRLDIPPAEALDLAGRVVRQQPGADGVSRVAIEFVDPPAPVTERLSAVCMLYEALFPSRRKQVLP